MKPNTIAESMAALRLQLDSIDQPNTPITPKQSTLQEHMNAVDNGEYLSEAGKIPNFFRGMFGANPKGARGADLPPFRDPTTGSMTGRTKTWIAPNADELASHAAGLTTGNVAKWLGIISIPTAIGAWTMHEWDKAFHPEQHQNQGVDPKFDPAIYGLQQLLNKTFHAGLVEDGFWGKATKEAFEKYMVPISNQTKVEPKVQSKVEPKADQKQSTDLNVQPLPSEITNQKTNTPPVTPLVNPPTGADAQPTPTGPKQPPTDSLNQLNQLFQQMKDANEKLRHLEQPGQ